MFAALFKGNKRSVLVRAGVLISVIAVVDRLVIAEIPLGFLYLIPMLMVGSVGGRISIAATAVVCTVLTELFSDLTWNLRMGLSRDVLYLAAFLGAGLFIREVNKSRKVALENLHAIETERDARREAEQQLNILIGSSPLAIVTADFEGRVLMANEATQRMLGVPLGELAGRSIYKYLPALTNISMHDSAQQHLCAVMQARGQREDGEAFLADICFSTYKTSAGTRLAAMVLDGSDDLRAHEESGLHQLLEGSRIAVGALSHEIRNICGAIGAVHQNLKRNHTLEASKDFEALGSLVETLESIANLKLGQRTSQAGEVDLSVLLDELKIVVTPQLDEAEIEADWNVEQGLPLVWASRSSLMQVFLNIVANSVRALATKAARSLSITARCEGEQVIVEVVDSGGGVTHPENLFRPFQAGAEATGLGLYLSRAFMRSFGGELRYGAIEGGACFIVELAQANATSQELEWTKSAY
jgi:PAS domain S-box-containing protein